MRRRESLTGLGVEPLGSDLCSVLVKSHHNDLHSGAPHAPSSDIQRGPSALELWGSLTAGFLDRVVADDELRSASLSAAEELAALDPAAHAATKLRARADALKSLCLAIESELMTENLDAQTRK